MNDWVIENSESLMNYQHYNLNNHILKNNQIGTYSTR